MGFWDEDHRGKMPLSSHHIENIYIISRVYTSQHIESIYYTRVYTDLPLLILRLVIWLREHLSVFFTFSPLSILYSLEGSRYVHLRSEQLCSTSLRVQFLHKLFEILLKWTFVFSPPFNYSIIYLYLYGCMGIYFILLLIV